MTKLLSKAARSAGICGIALAFAAGLAFTACGGGSVIGYVVAFNSNGGSAVKNETVKPGDLAVKPADPTYTGHSFQGWFKDNNSFIEAWDFDADRVNAPLTLYAKWQEVICTVDFSKNFPEGTYSNYAKIPSIPYGSTLGDNMPANPPNQSGSDGYTYLFRAWDEKADGSGGVFDKTTPVEPATGETLDVFAIWDKSPSPGPAPTTQYRIIYNENGGNGNIPSQFVTVGGTATLSDGSGFSERTGAFKNWNTKADGTGTSYAGGATFGPMPSNDVTLYAQWTPYPEYTLSYYIGDDATGATPPTTKRIQGSTVTLAKGTGITRGSDTLSEWKSSAYPDTQFAPGGTYTMPGQDDTLTAVWTPAPNQPTITYNLNGGTGTPPQAVSETTGNNVKLDDGSKFSRAGYIFGPWNTAADGSGTSYPPGENITMPAYSMTLYAMWTAGSTPAGTYTITYFNGNGLGTIASQTAGGGTQIKISDGKGFTKDFYTFTQWIPSGATFTGYINVGAVITMPNANIVLTPAWTDSGMITVNSTGTTYEAPTPVSATAGDDIYSYDSIFKNGNDDSVTFTVSNYRIAATELTWSVWSRVKTWAVSKGYKFKSAGQSGYNSSAGDNQPVTSLDWASAMVWCNALSEYQGIEPVYYFGATVVRDSTNIDGDGSHDWLYVTMDKSKNGYRLPTEMEWEIAARGNASSSWNDLWPGTNSNWGNYVVGNTSGTSVVKSKQPNLLGLYDMGGNALEWCYDWWDAPPSTTQNNYSGPAQTDAKYKTRVLKGGIFGNGDGYVLNDVGRPYYWNANDCTCAVRFQSFYTTNTEFSSEDNYYANMPGIRTAGIRLARNAQ